MKVECDPRHDIMNIRSSSSMAINESFELDDGVILDYSKGKNVSTDMPGVKKGGCHGH